VVPPLEGAFAFSATEVWFASSVPIKWNGNFAALYHLYDMGILTPDDGSVSKVWGSNPRDIYFVGRKGSVVHYDGSNWQKLPSGTTVDIQDIWGAGQAVLAVASFINYGRGLDLLQIQGTSVAKLDTAGLRIALSSVWFSNDQDFYLAGDGLFTKNKLTDLRWDLHEEQPSIYKRRVRGNAGNDVFVVGDFGLVSHYNGSSWRHYRDREVPSFFGLLSSAAVTRDVMVAVGEINDRALVLRAKRH
jgi:hypothetical protein